MCHSEGARAALLKPDRRLHAPLPSNVDASRKMGITYRALLKGIHQNQIDGDTPFPLNP
jgi:hypothetical protein